MIVNLLALPPLRPLPADSAFAAGGFVVGLGDAGIGEVRLFREAFRGLLLPQGVSPGFFLSGGVG